MALKQHAVELRASRARKPPFAPMGHWPCTSSDVEKAAALKSSCNKETWLQKGSFAGSRLDDAEVTKSTDD